MTNNSVGAAFLVSMSHKYILQCPKDLDTNICTILIDDFIEGILRNFFVKTYKMLDDFTKMMYKTYVFNQMEPIRTNTKLYFVFDDKQLIKLTKK